MTFELFEYIMAIFLSIEQFIGGEHFCESRVCIKIA